MEIHPFALLIPPMSQEELEKLTTDIRQNGLLDPIMTFEGKILDGRHRYQACANAGVTPRYEEFAGAEPVSFVLSKNLHRRHLTSAQKAAIGAEALPLLEARAKERQVSLAGTRPASTDLSQKIDKGRAAEEAARLRDSSK